MHFFVRPVVSGIAVLLLVLGTPMLGAQGVENGDAEVQAELQLKGDPAPDFDLGGTRLVGLPTRDGERGPIVAAPYVCLSCLASKNQVVSADDGRVAGAHLLGQEATAIRPYLQRLSKNEAVILVAPRLNLICVTGKAKAKGLTPLEETRLRAWLGEGMPKTLSSLEAHEAAHVWMERLLLLDAAVADLLDLDPQGAVRPVEGGMRPLPHRRAEMILFSEPEVHQGFVSHMFGSNEAPAEGRLTEEGPLAALLLEGSPEVQVRRFIHSAALQLLKRERRLEGGLPDWLQIGIAHFLERRLHGATERDPGTLPAGMECPPDWDQFVRDLVSAGKSALLVPLTMTPLRALSLKTRVQSWSLVKYLVGIEQGQRFRLLCRHLLSAPPGRTPEKSLEEAIKAAYGADLATVERAWKLWVTKGRK